MRVKNLYSFVWFTELDEASVVVSALIKVWDMRWAPWGARRGKCFFGDEILTVAVRQIIFDTECQFIIHNSAVVQKLTVWFNFKRAYKVVKLRFLPLKCGKSEVWNRGEKSNSTSWRNQRDADSSVGKPTLELSAKSNLNTAWCWKRSITPSLPLTPTRNQRKTGSVRVNERDEGVIYPSTSGLIDKIITRLRWRMKTDSQGHRLPGSIRLDGLLNMCACSTVQFIMPQLYLFIGNEQLHG